MDKTEANSGNHNYELWNMNFELNMISVLNKNNELKT